MRLFITAKRRRVAMDVQKIRKMIEEYSSHSKRDFVNVLEEILEFLTMEQRMEEAVSKMEADVERDLDFNRLENKLEELKNELSKIGKGTNKYFYTEGKIAGIEYSLNG